MNPLPGLGVCTVAEWPALLAALDETFVTERGRSGSLAIRFPAALGQPHLADLRVVRNGAAIVSCCATRRFDWHTPAQSWRGAMIGMVWTRPDARGRGHAAQVLDFTLQALDADGVDFAVLWSSLPHFYARLGWQRHDRGVLGVSAGTAATAPRLDAAFDPTMLEPLRATHEPLRVLRTADAWQARPLPAAHTRLLADETGAAYALLGEQDDTRYVYEVVGEPGCFPALWARISAGAGRVYVNDSLGSPFHRWLVTHTATQFNAQSLAHWWPLSHRGRAAHWRGWHIPWFDRI